MPITLKEVIAARLISVEMPSSFYVFKSAYGNTSLRVTVYDTSSGPITKTITIDDGNYNGVSIGTELQAKLDTAFSPLTFTCLVSQTTLKCSIENLDGFDVEVHTNDSPDHIGYAKTLPYFLGYAFDTTSKGNPTISQNVANINPYTYAYIDIPELGSGVHEGGMYGTTFSPSANAFSKIPINNNSFEYTFWEPQTSTTVHMHPTVSRLDRLTIRWRFHDMTPIDFHNLDHSFSIEFITKSDRDVQLDDIAHNVRCIADRLNSSEKEPSTISTTHIHAERHKDDAHDQPPLISRQLLIALCCVILGVGLFWFFNKQPLTRR
ncbi:MAG: hypothetical protein ACO35C_05230 [Pontimonas sp.]